MWTAFELSWLNARGKPQVALAHFTIPRESTHRREQVVRSTLNSFNSRFADASEVLAALALRRRQSARPVWHGGLRMAGIGARLVMPESFGFEPLDELGRPQPRPPDIECTRYQLTGPICSRRPSTSSRSAKPWCRTCSRARSVTGQPDWGSGVQIRHSGPR